jgi:hypothetical protein
VPDRVREECCCLSLLSLLPRPSRYYSSYHHHHYCSPTRLASLRYESSSAPSTYVANIEAFTLGLDHSAYAMMPDGETIVGSAAGLVGILKSSSDKQCAEHPATDAAVNGYPTDVAPCYIVTNRTSAGMDLIRVDMLLEAAGASLDAANNGGGSSGKPYRNTGAMLIVNVQCVLLPLLLLYAAPARCCCCCYAPTYPASRRYSNIRPWGAPSNKVLHYEYDPVFLEGGSYKAFYTSYEEFRSSRVLVSSHGINVEAAVSGTFHGWDFQAFLVTITASFTLLAGVSVLIEFFAMYLAPDAQKFSSAKYEEITLHSASEFHAMTTDFAGGVAGGIGAAAGGVAGGLGAAAGGIAGATGLGGRRTSAGPAPQAAEISDRDSLNAPLV